VVADDGERGAGVVGLLATGQADERARG